MSDRGRRPLAKPDFEKVQERMRVGLGPAGILGGVPGLVELRRRGRSVRRGAREIEPEKAARP